MLKIESLSCNYSDSFFLKNISFNVEGGEKICVVGPNGCGKSTLLKAIVGLIKYDGNIYLENKLLSKIKRKDMAVNIGFMSQMTSVYFSYSVFETVMLGRYAHIKNSSLSRPTKFDEDYVLECLKKVNILNLKDRNITELSGGELQRVFLARIFAQNPKIILLDEPTNHLDLKNQIELIEHLKVWTKDKEKSVIAVLHDINLAIGFADKILLLSEGNQVAFESKKYLLEKNLFNEVYGLDIKKYMLLSFNQWNI